MSRQIIIFEDEDFRNLLPIAHTRPVFDIRCGVDTLADKAIQAYPGAQAGFRARPELAKLIKQQKGTDRVNARFEGRALLLNGRVLWDESLAERVPAEGPERIYTQNGTIVAARLDYESLGKVNWSKMKLNGQFNAIPKEEIEADEIHYSWDAIYKNRGELVKDFKRRGCNGAKEGKVYNGAFLVDPANITIAAGAKIKPCAVIDAEDGPVFIDEGAEIMPHTFIQGPCYIGKNSIVKPGAKIYHGATIGDVCKIGGEVEESIFHSHSNKQHDGFIGHSYIGMWVNIGADTNNSDLKNNYGEVKCFVNGEPVLTGHQFMGLTMGDHSKSGINTMFNTGTVIGVCCNLFGPGFLPKYIPSFSWGGQHRLVEYRLDKCVEVARRVMKRRNVELTETEEDLLHKIFEKELQQRLNFYLLMQ